MVRRSAVAWPVLLALALATLGTVVAIADLYEVLGVERTATPKEIKRAYRAKALELHPDKLGGNVTEEDEQRFIDVVTAYETLSDPDKRRNYDTYGPEESAAPIVTKSYHTYPFDMYVSLPGGAFEFHWKPPSKPSAPSMTIPLTLTLEEVYTGASKEVNVTRQRICPVCGGTGALTHDHSHTCTVCDGHGWHLYLHEHSNGYKHIVNKTCEYCQGTGNQPNETCPKCGGRRVTQMTDSVTVKVVPGTPSGTQVNLRGGAQAIGHTDGSLAVVVHIAQHPKFRLSREMDLVYDARISLIDALIGFTRYVTLLNGTKLEVVHDVVTFAGYQMVFEGLGMPRAGKPGEFTDLVIEFAVSFPRRLTSEQRNILKDIMNDQEIEILESVIRLAMARDAEIAGAAMKDEELRYSSVCDPEDPFICVPDERRHLEWIVERQAERNARRSRRRSQRAEHNATDA